MATITNKQINELRKRGLTDQEISSFSQKYGMTIDPRSGLQKVTEGVNKVFAGGKVGEAIGTLGGYAFSKNKAEYDLSGPKPLQVAGDIAQGALQVGGLKAPIGKTATSRIIQSSKLGAGLSGTGAIAEGDNIKDIARKTTAGAIVGAVAQAPFELIPKIGTFTAKQANRLRIKNLRLSPVQRQQLQNKLPEITDYLKTNKIKGSPEKQFVEVGKKYDKAENLVQKTLKESKVSYNKKELVDYVNSIPDKYATEFDNPEVFNQLQNKSNKLAQYIQVKFPDNIPADKVNEFKRQYFKNAFNKAGDAVQNEARLAIGDELYKKLLQDIPDLQSLNKEYSTIILTKKVLGKALGRNELGAIGNLVALGVGGSVGASLGGPAGAAVGSAVAIPVAKKVAGTAARTNIATALEQLQKIAKENPTSAQMSVPRSIIELLLAGD